MEIKSAQKFKLTEGIDYVAGGIASKQIIKKKEGNITLFSFAKREGLSEHTAPFDALVQIIEGKAEVFIDRKSHLLDKDDLIIMPANIPHAINAVENFKMLLVMIKSEKV